MMAFENNYHHESDADDEFERGSTILSPTLPSKGGYESSPTESERYSPEHTPTTITHSTINAASPTAMITQWTPEQCAEYVSSLGLPKYSKAIIDHEIDGLALIALRIEELKEIGVSSVGHRLTILKGVYEVKLRQNVPVEEDHYVPLSADANAPDAHATQDDVLRITQQIKYRDDRISQAEADLRELREETESQMKALREDIDRVLEDQRKFREETLPILRQFKNHTQPLPTPTEGPHLVNSISSPNLQQQQQSGNRTFLSSGLTEKVSKHSLYSSSKMPSPTLHDPGNVDSSPAAQAASKHLTTSLGSDSQLSPKASNQPSPTSPPTSGRTYGGSSRNDPSSWWSSQRSASTLVDRGSLGTSSGRRGEHQGSTSNQGSSGSSGSRSNSTADDPNGFMKAFRVSMEEPCRKVLPVALKKYNIQDDWQQYSLYIVHGDQERCLGLDEKPLILFKALANEGKKPMFMLRKHAAPETGYQSSRTDGGGSGMGSNNDPRTGSLSVPPGGMSRASYASNNASTVQLPGGVL